MEARTEVIILTETRHYTLHLSLGCAHAYSPGTPMQLIFADRKFYCAILVLIPKVTVVVGCCFVFFKNNKQLVLTDTPALIKWVFYSTTIRLHSMQSIVIKQNSTGKRNTKKKLPPLVGLLLLLFKNLFFCLVHLPEAFMLQLGGLDGGLHTNCPTSIL